MTDAINKGVIPVRETPPEQVVKESYPEVIIVNNLWGRVVAFQGIRVHTDGVFRADEDTRSFLCGLG
jgi:hypothetical protein